MIDKLKQLTKDTAIYGLSTILGRFLNFLLVPFYTNVFKPDTYGVISNYYAFMGLMNIVFLYGMDSAYIKYAAIKDPQKEKDVFSTPFIIVSLTSFYLVSALLSYKMNLVAFLGFTPAMQNDYSLVYYTAAILFLDSLTVIPYVALRLERKAKKFSIIRISNIFINIILNLLLISVFKMGIKSVFIANIAASASSLILLIPTIKEKLKINIDFILLKKLLKFGIPYLPAGIGSMIIQVIDRPILSKLTDMKTVGIYQANYKLGIFMMLFVSMFQFAWQPFFMQHSKEKNAKELFSKVLTYFTLFASTILILLTLYIDNIVKTSIFGRHLIGEAYWGGIHIIPIILLGYMFNGIYIVFTAGIFIKEKSIYVPFIIGFAALMNIVVNYLLIPRFSITGAAFATFFSYLIMAGGFYFVTQKFYNIEYEYSKLIKTFILIFVLGLIYYYLYFQNLLFIWIKLIITLAFFIFIGVFILDNKERNYIFSKIRLYGKNSA